MVQNAEERGKGKDGNAKTVADDGLSLSLSFLPRSSDSSSRTDSHHHLQGRQQPQLGRAPGATVDLSEGALGVRAICKAAQVSYSLFDGTSHTLPFLTAPRSAH